MRELDVSVVVPTYNMGAHLPALWGSLVASGVVGRVREVLFVDDGSTDSTPEVLAGLAAAGTPEAARLRVLRLPENVNRFRARLEGARVAAAARLLFLDARVQLPAGFGEGLEAAARTHTSACGVVDIDVARNVFCLYWDRSHRLLFRRYYRELDCGIVLTPQNFHLYLKGTGVFLCERDLFVRACEAFAGQVVLSDDNRVMEAMVAHTPIAIDPRMRVLWTPRESAGAFLARLWERGPSFVEYHVFTRRAGWFPAYLVGLGTVAAWGGALVARPALALALLGAGVGLVAASTAALARGPREALRMAPLHVATVAVFGVGVLRGTAVHLVRLCRGEVPTLEKPV